MIDQKKKEEAIKLIENATNITLTTHINPDDDAIGSVLGLKWFIKKSFKDKKVNIIISGEKKERWDFLKNYSEIEWANDISNNLVDTDLLILADIPSVSKVTNFPEKIDFGRMKSICIDHHSKNQGENFDLVIGDTVFAATSQLIVDLFFSDEDLKNKDIAEALLNGIIGDTGGFKFINKENSSVFTTAKRIIDNSRIQIQALELKTAQILPLELEIIGELIKNTINVNFKNNIPNATYSFLSNGVLRKYDSNTINAAKHIYMGLFLRKIKNYPWGFVVVPIDKAQFGISFRSMPNSPDVSALSNEYFNGGGHKMSSGGSYESSDDASTKEVCERIVEIIKKAKIEIVPNE